MNITRRMSSVLPRRIDSALAVLLAEPRISRTTRSSRADFDLGKGRRSLSSSATPFSTRPPLESSLLCPKTTTVVRLYNRQTVHPFSSQRRRKNNKKPQDSNTILANEKLIAALMQRNPQRSGPEDIPVRLVLDQPTPDAPAKVEVMSLAEAIRASLEEMVDLVGVSIDNDPPVIRGTDLAKLIYKREQAVGNTNKKGGKKSNQASKSFRFRAGIDTHDLDRKVKLMIEALEKGVECDYTVFTKGRMMRENPDAGVQLVDRVQQLVAKCGQLKRAPHKNPTGNFIRAQVEPILSTKSNK